ncbi:DMT family transporter [Sulfurimonas sp. MAG313]|nr:DMT family transporter [Sulfurimonas sp. MAG313]MDF1880296.1 DMT family transporter [Sulfurimonas sp. MAG313]
MQVLRFSLALVLAMFLWGGGWTALKILTQSVGVEVLSLWRFIIMVLAFIPILLYIKKPLQLSKESFKYILISSCLNVAFMIFAYLGVQGSFAGSGGVIITILSPIFTFIFSAIFFKVSYFKHQYLGMFIGIIGSVIMLNIHDLYGFMHTSEVYFVLAALVWAGVTFLAQKSNSYIHPVHYSFFIACFSMIILLVLNIGQDITIVFRQDQKFWMALLYLGVFAQAIATTIYFIASGKLGSSKASSYMLLVPIFALIISYSILDEPMQFHIVIGGIISLFSVYLINKNKAKM